METNVNEIAPDIYQLSTYVEPVGLAFNQYLLDGDEPLLFHCGPRQMFPLVSEAVQRVIPVTSLRWISFGHVESDECGAMNDWLAAAPDSQVVHGVVGVAVSVNDLADRPPRVLTDGETIDLGGHVVQWIDTSHVPHGWESGLLHEQRTGTLLCGDLFTATGRPPAVTESDPVQPALAAEDQFHATALTPATGPTIRGLGELKPSALALMHGPVFRGDTVRALSDLGDALDGRLWEALSERTPTR